MNLKTVRLVFKRLNLFDTILVLGWWTVSIDDRTTVGRVHSRIFLRKTGGSVLADDLLDYLLRWNIGYLAFDSDLLWSTGGIIGGGLPHDLLILLHLLVLVVIGQLDVKGVSVWLVPLLCQTSIVLALFVCLLSLFLSVIKGAYFRFITASSLLKKKIKTWIDRWLTSQNIRLYLSGWYSLSTVVWHLLHLRPLSHLSHLSKSKSEKSLPYAFDETLAVLCLVFK